MIKISWFVLIFLICVLPCISCSNSEPENMSAGNQSGNQTDQGGQQDSRDMPTNCSPLTVTIGEIINVTNISELQAAVLRINEHGGNFTVLLEDGTYNIPDQLFITGSNVVFRGKSGDRNRVIINGGNMHDGAYMGFGLAGSNITIADMSIGEVQTHAIQIHGERPYQAGGILVHNVRLFNTGEQMLKGATDDNTGSANGTVECSLFEYTSNFGPQYYIGGIDVHMGNNWLIRKNVFKNIRSPENADRDHVAEHAIHFWNGSGNVTVEKNKIINCDRGIGFGMSGRRPFQTGTIRNNMIYNNGAGRNDDSGIILEDASQVEVYNNTVFFESNYPNAIEYRFPGTTNVQILGNLTNRQITLLDGASANVANNITEAQKSWFRDPSNGDLHLNTQATTVIDQGPTITGVTDDIDDEVRPHGTGYDVGADETI